jgi:predicted nucleic acid-binding protein
MLVTGDRDLLVMADTTTFPIVGVEAFIERFSAR